MAYEEAVRSALLRNYLSIVRSPRTCACRLSMAHSQSFRSVGGLVGSPASVCRLFWPEQRMKP